MLAQTWKGQDVRGWWLSEKYDGCRAFWDGFVLRTREAWLPILAPLRLTSGLPNGIALDGEIWAGRGTFEAMRILVQTKRPNHPGWDKLPVRFMVFDAPTCDAIPFEQRMPIARKLADAAGAGFVEQARVGTAEDAQAAMRHIVSEGGEGVMLRRPGHCYAFERSRDWLKMKPGLA